MAAHSAAVSSLRPIRCIEKERLTDEFLAAVHEHIAIQSAQIEAVKANERFQSWEELANALERRHKAKYAIIEHQEQHGC